MVVGGTAKSCSTSLSQKGAYYVQIIQSYVKYSKLKLKLLNIVTSVAKRIILIICSNAKQYSGSNLQIKYNEDS